MQSLLRTPVSLKFRTMTFEALMMVMPFVAMVPLRPPMIDLFQPTRRRAGRLNSPSTTMFKELKPWKTSVFYIFKFRVGTNSDSGDQGGISTCGSSRDCRCWSTLSTTDCTNWIVFSISLEVECSCRERDIWVASQWVATRRSGGCRLI